MEIALLIIVSIFAAVWAGLAFWSSLHRLQAADYHTDIENELKQYGLQLTGMRDPLLKERVTSPFGWARPALLVGGMPVTLHEKFTQKVIFQNQHGVTGENWLEIRRNRWNGQITLHWSPVPAHFQHLKSPSRF